jgi:hypothetical protein
MNKRYPKTWNNRVKENRTVCILSSLGSGSQVRNTTIEVNVKPIKRENVFDPIVWYEI